MQGLLGGIILGEPSPLKNAAENNHFRNGIANDTIEVQDESKTVPLGPFLNRLKTAGENDQGGATPGNRIVFCNQGMLFLVLASILSSVTVVADEPPELLLPDRFQLRTEGGKAAIRFEPHRTQFSHLVSFMESQAHK